MSAAEFTRCIRAGAVALFPSDTVYGLACDPEDAAAVQRLYAIKRRPPDKAAAVMFFDLDAALGALPELGPRTRVALERLMPGAVTAVLPNPRRRFPLAGRADPESLGLRVVTVPALQGVEVPVLQSSANLSGGPDARRLPDVAAAVRDAVDVTVDGGELPGVASTVIDFRGFEAGGLGAVSIVRAGAVGEAEIATALAGQFHFDPDTYLDMVRFEVPAYEELQSALVAASGEGARSLLELGTGTGETACRLLARHPEAELVGIDESRPMLDRARTALAACGGQSIDLRAGRLQDPLPGGPFELVASALSVHHLDADEKARLFRRIRAVLVPGGRFVLGDVVVRADGAAALTPLSDGYDKPSTVAEQLAWLAEAGFVARVVWERDDLAVIVAEVR